jgi:hypothetical protein
MASQIDICNLALSWIGGKKIYDLAENSVEAQLVSTNYPLSRDAVLAARMWTFATKQATPSPAVGTPPVPWTYQYLIPSDCLRVFRVTDGNDIALGNQGANNLPWERQGQYILCDSSSIIMTYVTQVLDPTLFSPGLVQALAARMAADLAVTYTENRSLQADLWKIYDEKMKEAAAVDGGQGRNDRFNKPVTFLGRRRYS